MSGGCYSPECIRGAALHRTYGHPRIAYNSTSPITMYHLFKGAYTYLTRKDEYSVVIIGLDNVRERRAR